jgi:hypothetical protein
MTEKLLSEKHPDDFKVIEIRVHKRVLRDLESGHNVRGLAGNLYGIQDAFIDKLLGEIRSDHQTAEFIMKEDKEGYGKDQTKSGD